MRIGWEKGGGGEMCLNKKERERREKERCENFGSSLQEEIERGGGESRFCPEVAALLSRAEA